jgi:hypothetical protein
MLPDFPKTKSEISKILSARVRDKVRELSPFASLPSAFVQHEGNVHSYPQEGFGTVTDGFEHFEVPLQVKIEELRSLVGDRLLQKIDGLAEEMARKTSEHGYRALDRVTEKAGNRLDAGGKPFDQEMFLAMMEKVDLTFDASGKPDFVLLMHPDMASGIAEKGQHWEQDPEFKKRYDDLLEVKREAWRDRESNRKLVD